MTVEAETNVDVQIEFSSAGSLIAEIFAAGTWNSMKFDEKDLDGIAATFDKLRDIHKVPLKFGHNSSQPMTDGQPALGWVDRVWREGSKLMAKFTDVPELVMSAIKKKLYRKVSVELDVDVKHGDNRYDYVLSGVALLGADIPAVNVLADLHALMSKQQSALVFSQQRAVFSSSINQSGGASMNLEEMKKENDTLKQENGRLLAENAQLKGQNSLLTVERDNFARRDKEREANERQEKLTAKRKEVNEWCEDAVKSGNMLPAQRELFKQAVGFADDDRLLATDVEPFKKMFAVKRDPQQGDHGGGSGYNSGGKSGESATQQIMRMTRDRMSQFKESFTTAQERVLQTCGAELQRQYQEEMTKEVA